MADTAHPSDKSLQDWLVERVAAYGGVNTESVAVDRPLAELGLDSIYALALCGEIEDEFDLEVDPTIAWDHPTVDLLAAELGRRLSDA